MSSRSSFVALVSLIVKRLDVLSTQLNELSYSDLDELGFAEGERFGNTRHEDLAAASGSTGRKIQKARSYAAALLMSAQNGDDLNSLQDIYESLCNAMERVWERSSSEGSSQRARNFSSLVTKVWSDIEDLNGPLQRME